MHSKIIKALFSEHVPPQDERVLEQVRRLFPMKWDAYEPSESIAHIFTELSRIRGGVFPTMLELSMGEGFISFANEAMAACFSSGCSTKHDKQN